MSYPKKCIIDNWSLEHAGVLLESTNDLDQSKHDSLIKNLGGLSNFITALLLYEDSYFPINGFEKDWKRFSWFETNASAFIEGVQLDELNVNWNSPASYEDMGISNYLLASRSFESDLLVCPERSEEITNYTESVDNVLVETLREIDKKIIHEANNSLLNKTKTGIKRNFQFPSLTQYVLSEASTREDLLKVIMQLKSDGKIRKVITEIEQITSTTQGAGKFENYIEYLVKQAFGRKVDKDHSWSISVSVPFFSISKSIEMNFFRRKEYLVFLKDSITCRSEAYRIEKDFQRIFKKKLRL